MIDAKSSYCCSYQIIEIVRESNSSALASCMNIVTWIVNITQVDTKNVTRIKLSTFKYVGSTDFTDVLRMIV